MMKKNTKTPTLGRDALRLTTSKVITMVITMLTAMLLSRFRTTEEYGTYSQILLVINLFTTMLMLGLPNSINYFLARADTPEEREKFLSVFYTISTLLSAFIGLVLVLGVPLIEMYFHNSNIGKFYYFLAVYPWASIISSSIENVLVVFKKTTFLMVYRVIHSVAMLAAVVVIKLLNLGFSEYMISFVAVNAAFAVSVYVIAGRLSGGIRVSFDKSLIKAIFVFSIPMGLAAVVATLNTEIDKLLIGYLMSTDQLAIYTNAAKELPLAIVPASITAVLLPRLTRLIKNGETEKAINLWKYATELALMVICFFVAGVFTYAEEVITILYSEKYLPGVAVFRVYSLNLLLRATYFGIVLNAFGKTKKILWCSILSMVLNAILNPLFYWAFGMIGPAIATFIAILVILILQLKMTTKITGVSFGNVFPWLNMGKVLLLNICFAGLFWGLKRIIPLELLLGGIAESVILGTIWAATYFFLMKRRIKQIWMSLNREGDE